MLFAKALKHGVTGPDWQGKSYTYAQDESMLIRDFDKGYYELHKDEFVLQTSNAITNDTGLPKRTIDYGWRNVGKNVAYGTDIQGGGQQWVFRAWGICEDDAKAGDTVKLIWSKAVNWTEKDVNNRTLAGATWQILVEYPPMSGNLIPAYNTRMPNGLVTTTFDNGKGEEVWNWVTPKAIKAGTPAPVWIWTSNGFINAPGSSRGKASGKAAGSYKGDFAFFVANTSGSHALYTEGNLVGLSTAAREALVNDSTNSYHCAPFAIAMYTNKVSWLKFGDSNDQRGGSTYNGVIDESYTHGIGDRLLPVDAAVGEVSAANDGAIKGWVNLPAQNSARRDLIKYFTHGVFLHGTNDHGLFADPQTHAQMKASYDAFFEIAEIKKYIRGWVAITTPVYSVDAYSIPADFYTTGSLSDASKTSARVVYNDIVRNDPRWLRLWDLAQYFESKDTNGRLTRPANARPVTASISANSDILVLDPTETATFDRDDIQLRVVNNNLLGAGQLGDARIIKILSPTQAKLSRVLTSAVATSTFYIGALHWNGVIYTGFVDKTHRSPNFFLELPKVGEQNNNMLRRGNQLQLTNCYFY